MELILVLTSWLCQAQGYDANNSVRTVTGQYTADRATAQQTALDQCRMQGLTACMITTCFGAKSGRHPDDISK